MSDPDTADEWLSLADQHRIVAMAVVGGPAAGQAHFHAGLGVECALKAYIMRRERLDGWPSRAVRPELYTHDLRRLREIAGIVVDHRSPEASSWHLLFQWDRNQGYDPNPMPRKVANDWVEAAFGPAGLVTWIRRNFP